MTTGRHYLDHASTTPLRPSARQALLDAIDAGFGDPSRIHHDGMAGRVALEDARAVVAECFGARPREVVFTSGATESIVAAAWGGAARGAYQVVAAVEHSAVRLAAERHGAVHIVEVDSDGRVDPERFLAHVNGDVGVAHLQWVNHEVGTVQPVADVAAGCRERGVLIHLDAAQAAGRVPLDFAESGADLVSISGHKLGAPAGTGALLVRRGVRVDPLMVGGDQERARRGGLENVVGAIAFAAAVADIDVVAESRAQALHRDAIEQVALNVEDVTRYGPSEGRAPHISCVGIGDVEPQAVLLGLDRRRISAHSGSACASEGLEPSPVLEAMGIDAHHSLRLSVGWSTSDADVAAFAAAFPQVVADLRSLRV